METKEQVLQSCTIHDPVVKLPNVQLDRKLYMEVAKSLELIGGKWKGGKVAGFVFPQDPTELLEQVANGEKRNLKKEYQFFATPDELADDLVRRADILPGNSILEPSAGQGAIIDAVIRSGILNKLCTDLFYVEKMPTNLLMLKKKNYPDNVYYVGVLNDDFLNMDTDRFDRIIANPPFSNNQDIDHIYHMYARLFPGGRIVTVASSHWEVSSNKKEKAFREWLEKVGADVEDIPAGVFKESGTMVGGKIITINKPK